MVTPQSTSSDADIDLHHPCIFEVSETSSFGRTGVILGVKLTIWKIRIQHTHYLRKVYFEGKNRVFKIFNWIICSY